MPHFIVAAATWIAAEVGEAALAATGSHVIAAVVADVTFYAAEVAAYTAIAYGVNAAFAPGIPGPAAIQTPIKSGFAPRRSGFGRARLGGVYVLFEAASDGGIWTSYDVLAAHDGEIDAWEQWYLHDDKVDVDPSTGGVWCPSDTRKYAYGGPPGDRTFIEHRQGLAAETVFARANAVMPTIWTATHRGDGVASFALTCKQSKDKFQQEDFPNGVPVPSAVARLQKVFDPRQIASSPIQSHSDRTTWTWSDNPVLALLSYLTDAAGGMGLDYTTRILPSINDWIDAANACDVAVSLEAGGTEKKYRLGGVYTHDSQPADVINQILASFDGWLAQKGDGSFKVMAGVYSAPTVTIVDKYVKSYSVQHFLPDEQAVNELVPNFTDPDADYTTADAGAWRDEPDIAARGKVRSQTLDLPWVQSATQARRLAKRKMNRLTQELRGQIVTNLYGLNALGERYLQLEITENASLASLVVEVAKVEIDLANLQVTFDWVAADANIDDWTPATDEATTSTGAAGPSPTALSAPTITAVSPVYEASAGGDTGARLEVTVSAPTEAQADVSWLLRWRLQGATDWHEATFSDIADGSSVTLMTGFVTATGNIEIQAAYRTSSGTISPWSNTWTQAVDAPATGATQTGLTTAEALSAGDLVNITANSPGCVQKADAALGYEAHGWVSSAFAAGAAATVHFGGKITGLSGLTKGPVYLRNRGALSSTAPVQPDILQQVGIAVSSTEAIFFPQEPGFGSIT